MTDEMFDEISALEQVEAIALGGSRAGMNYDEKSDYDVYVYITAPVGEETRRAIISKYCSYMEIGNHYWEYEDNCVLNDGTDIDIIYRDLDGFIGNVSDVVEKYHAHNGYTTCMWHNLLNCRIIYDKGRLAAAKERFSVSYPEKLRSSIITRNYDLLCNSMPTYSAQIEKACRRGDKVSIIHRTAAFLEPYFDIIFALNSMTHPGEKRLVELCVKQCGFLPDNFEKNLNTLLSDLPDNMEKIPDDIENIISCLKGLL